jgi:formylmethanofuran dehydrogenase subunit E
MVDFTTLMNRGHRRYIALSKRRKFAKCEDCGELALLVEYEDPYDDGKWMVCEFCYRQLQINEDE